LIIKINISVNGQNCGGITFLSLRVLGFGRMLRHNKIQVLDRFRIWAHSWQARTVPAGIGIVLTLQAK
jgi:hypothetical protein